MKQKLENLKQGILQWGAVTAIVGGSIFLSEKSGITNAFINYWDAQHQVYSKLDDKGLLNYAYDKNESIGSRNFRLGRYRVGADVGIGIMSVVNVGAIASLLSDKKYRKLSN